LDGIKVTETGSSWDTAVGRSSSDSEVEAGIWIPSVGSIVAITRSGVEDVGRSEVF
jgi:hypothetical protein